MTAEEIRAWQHVAKKVSTGLSVTLGTPDTILTAQAILLAEIAAQLAELNEHLRETGLHVWQQGYDPKFRE